MFVGIRLSVLALASGLLVSGCGPYHTLSETETVTFQPSVCRELPEGGNWSVTLRGAIYRSSWLNRIEPKLIEWLEAHHFVTGSEEALILEKRLQPFLDDHAHGLVLAPIVGERIHLLPASDPSGRLEADFVLTTEDVSKLQSAPSGAMGPQWITLHIRRAKGDRREFRWRIQVLGKRGWTVVSDIDDTIKITNVNNTKEMLKNTLVRPFRPVPGMAEVYSQWAAKHGAAFYYLSESSIELCEPLSDFIVSAGYPEGCLDLREIEWGQGRLKGFMSLMDAPPEYKLAELQRIISEFPERDYLLVGDSSQHDPEVYAETARKNPARVHRIFIRDVTCEGPEAPRYHEAFRELPRDLWQVFRDPAEIRDSVPKVVLE